VRRHHERCRLPLQLENSQQLSPKILAGQSTPKKSYEDFARKDMVSPPDLLAQERERLAERRAVSSLLALQPPEPRPVPVAAATHEDELPGQLPSIVETILANRKKLREAAKMGRMYKNPMQKEKKPKRMSQSQKAPDWSDAYGLMPTPGLPILTEGTKDSMVGSGFGDYRMYTLRRYLDRSSGAEAHLPPPPAVPSTGNRKKNVGLCAESVRQIFGLKTEVKMEAIKKENVQKVEEKVNVETNGYSAKMTTISAPSSTVTTPKKEKKKKEAKTPGAVITKPAVQAKSNNKFKPVLGRRLEVGKEDGSYAVEVGIANDRDSEVQTELGGFALDLLDDNLSWAKQVTIQNLVIWEPAETPIVILSKKKKGKKKGRARKSGLDFSATRRKGSSRSGGTSANGSRATSPVLGEEPHEVTHSVHNVVAESSR
jgi:hypothetical protein